MDSRSFFTTGLTDVTVMSQDYTMVIGLEVHVQLATKSKLFCRCSTAFGSLPNTQTCPVCIGMPGALPVMNREAFYLAMKTAIALNSEIPRFTKWDRKQYYYPDLPKGYQISQYDLPMSQNGYLDICDPKKKLSRQRVGIIRAHLEEDAGKSIHDDVSGTADSRIDLNRTGTPLLEIVTQPDLRSPAAAKLFLSELKLLLNYLGVSDCNMQEGSLRVDANVNLHVETTSQKVATPIVEVKNMNSFRSVERALAYEAQRQYAAWKRMGQVLGDVSKQTRGWEESAEVTRPQRNKEESSDYRYLPDPDLVPATVTEDEVAAIRADLGELPAALRSRLVEDYGVTVYDSDVLVNQGRQLVDYYQKVADLCGNGKLASNWVQQDVLRRLNELEIGIEQFPVQPEALADLILKVQAGQLDTSRSRDVLNAMVDKGHSADEMIRLLGITQVDEDALRALCEELLSAHPKIVDDLKQGKTKAAGALIGQAKKRNPNIDPNRVRELCIDLAKQL